MVTNGLITMVGVKMMLKVDYQMLMKEIWMQDDILLYHTKLT